MCVVTVPASVRGRLEVLLHHQNKRAPPGPEEGEYRQVMSLITALSAEKQEGTNPTEVKPSNNWLG